jgi:cell division protein ZipA
MEQYWLTIIIVVILIVGIVFDGFRRMRKARFDSLQMKLKPTKKKNRDESDTEETREKGFGSEFPNGGARVSSRTIDPDRIKEVRNKYNFGSDMSAWRERVVEKIAEHTGKLNPHDDDLKPDKRIEPSFEADPLMDVTASYTEKESEKDRGVEADSNSLENTFSKMGENSIDSSDETNVDSELSDKDHEALNDYAKHTQKSAVSNEVNSNELVDNKPELDEPVVDEPQVKQDSLATPVQVSLNLDDSVPMLMDTFDENQAVQAPAKKSYNPFSKSSQSKQSTNNSTNYSANNSTSKSGDTGANNSAHKNEVKKESSIGTKPSKGNAEVKSSSSTPSIPNEVLVIHVRASQENVFYGNELLELILEHGLRFGAMDIFHRHAGEDGEGPILFSLSNMVKPGIFDLHTFDEFSTVGVSLFLALPVETGSYMEAFDAMLATAKGIAEQLQGELKDENRSVLTGQTVEHYRERIRDFSRRQQLEKHKL